MMTYSTIVLLFIQLVHFSRNKMDPFIIGGDPVNINKFPHAVFLYIECAGEPSMCGSSVVTQNILLTAAHCVDECRGTPSNSIIALAGHENVDKFTVTRIAARYVSHEDYDEDKVIHDITLIYLREGLPLGYSIKRVIIRKFYNGKYAEVAGWGVLDLKSEKESEQLMKVKQKLKSNITCQKLGRLLPGQFCATGLSKKYLERPSKGDSGSALITDDYQQIGIVSYIEVTAPSMVVYTNVTYYYDWIKRKSKKLYCKGKA